MKWKYYRGLFTLIALSCLFAANAAEPLVLSAKTTEVFLTSRYFDLLEDPAGQLNIETVSSPGMQGLFKPFDQPYASNIRTGSTYWLRFRLKSKGAITKQFLLESFTFRVNFLDVFIPNEDGTYNELSTGNKLPFAQRSFHHKNFEFMLPNPGSKGKVFYLRFKSDMPLSLVLVIRSLKRFTSYALSEYYLLGLFYGIILVIAFYNLFLFFNIREKAYLFYVFYVLSVACYALSQDGTGFQYIWPGYPGFNAFGVKIFLFSLVICLLLYTKAFLPIKEKLPALNRLISIFIAVRIIYFIISILYTPKIETFYLIDLIPFILAYLAALALWREKYPGAKYFVAGFSILFFSFLINAMMYAGWIKGNIFTVYAVNLGVVLEMILLSIALADRVRVFREEKYRKEEENKKLELMVVERTKELETANLKLRHQADEIASMNLLLHADNKKLEEDVKRISEDRVMQNEMDFDAFSKIFPDENTCYNYLAELKWGNGYTCIRCNNNIFSAGKTQYSRRCSKCGYDESVSAYTLFHALKFPITKAFYMLFLVTEDENIIVEQLAEKLSLTNKTAWSFKKKILEAMTTGGKRKKGRKNNKWAHLIIQKGKKA